MKQQLRGRDGKQLCYLTSVIVSSAVNRSQSRDAFVTQTAATAMSESKSNETSKGVVSGDRLVPRLCTFPAPKAT